MASTVAINSSREQLLDSADRLIAKFGLRKTTMEDVANEAGVSRRTVYSHFGNKSDLALASIDRVVMQAQRRVQEEAATDEPAAEKLFRMLVARVATRIELVRDVSTSLDSIFDVVRPAYLEKRREYFEQEAQMLATVIEQGQLEGNFGGGDPVDTARLFVEATNAYLPYSLSLEDLDRPGDLQQRIKKLSAILVAGIIR